MIVYLIGHTYEFAIVEGVTALLGRAPDSVVRIGDAERGETSRGVAPGTAGRGGAADAGASDCEAVACAHGVANGVTAVDCVCGGAGGCAARTGGCAACDADGDTVVSALCADTASAAVRLRGRVATAQVAIATCAAARGAQPPRGTANAVPQSATDAYARIGAEQRALKRALYDALSQLTGGSPWGSLSGMRPTKLAAKLVSSCGSADAALASLISEYHVKPDKARLCMQCAERGIALSDTLQDDDVAIYVGIPFCPTRCSYCSFVSRSTGSEGALVAPYLDALIYEIKACAVALRDKRVVMLYIGGGTPTTLSAPQLDRLLTSLKTHIDLSNLREFTVEAGRCDTIDADKLDMLKRHGVTRIAINPQSLNDNVLRAVGRNHTAADVVNTFNLARQLGFDNINMDLIAGLPFDTAASFSATLDAVIALASENVTVHTLARKRGAGAALSETAHDSSVAEMVECASEKLSAAGYAPYYLYRQKYMAAALENVGWTRPGYECLYNIATMEELCGIAAFGAGAVSKYELGGKIKRSANPKFPKEYIEKFTEHPREYINSYP